MDIQEITKFALNNIIPILAGLGVIAVILLALLINLYMKVSYMKKRYRKMMTGADGANLERMLIGHLNEIQEVSEENAAIKRENERSMACCSSPSRASASCASARSTIWAVT